LRVGHWKISYGIAVVSPGPVARLSRETASSFDFIELSVARIASWPLPAC
jgi:hypothetical protein